jgi:hypothetical protein
MDVMNHGPGIPVAMIGTYYRTLLTYEGTRHDSQPLLDWFDPYHRALGLRASLASAATEERSSP